MEQYFDIQELLVILDCLDYFIEDVEFALSDSLNGFDSPDKFSNLNDYLLSKVLTLRSKVRDGVLLIDPEFELPY